MKLRTGASLASCSKRTCRISTESSTFRSKFSRLNILKNPSLTSPQLLSNSRVRLQASPGPGSSAKDAAGISSTTLSPLSAKDVIIKFYTAYNAGDIDTIASVMAEDVEYHDMIYEEPFRGRSEVVAYMKKVRATVPSDVQFCIDDITDGDPCKTGIMWHVEVGDGIPMPFSRGCSFYVTNDKGQISKARDLVEPAVKPGGSSLQLLGAVVPLIRKLGPSANPANLKKLPIAAAAVWAFYAGYMAYIMLSTDAPGLPAYMTPPDVLQEVLYESLNFFYVNVGLNAVGLSFIPDIPCPPVSEAVFNFVAAWGVLFLPVMLTEKKSAKVSNKWGWWVALMFVTNVFFIPFLALRAAPEPENKQQTPVPGSKAAQNGEGQAYPAWSRATAAIGLTVGLTSVAWFFFGRPEFGGLTERLEYFQAITSTNRVFYAFIVDACLYSVWQAAMLSTVPSASAFHRFVPFIGLAAHLLQAPTTKAEGEAGSNPVSGQQ